MIEKFSGGYYITHLDVQKVHGDPKIEQGVYDFINRKLYTDSSAPVTMRVNLSNNIHFCPEADPTMPPEVIGLPQSLYKFFEDDTRAKSDIFIVNGQHAKYL